MSVSVLTLVRGRRTHLTWLMRSLERQTRPPDELVVAYMQPELHAGLPVGRVPVRSIHVPGSRLPLAAARNAAAAAASGSTLVFLDVDCIASETLVHSYAQAVERADAVFMGEVLYLPAGIPCASLDYDQLRRSGLRHPSRPASPPRGSRVADDPLALWSLSFAMRRATYSACEGMDPGYVGYGGEDTDFAMRLHTAGVELRWLADAGCFHQFHESLAPPLHHFASIVTNAQRFRDRWGRWCMEYWLELFERAGLIRRSHDAVQVVRPPTPEEVAAARLPASARFG